MNNFSLKIVFGSELGYLPILRNIVRGICAGAKIENEHFLQDLDLCLNEAISNIICHGYQNKPGHEIQLIFTFNSDKVEVQIVDKGSKNPNIVQESTLNETSDIESMPESGRGLFIMNQLMDEVIYETDQEKNILLLRKRIK